MLERTLRPSPIAPTVDFSVEGVQHGFLRLPYSRDDSAWGSVMIPLTVIKNGDGPTALLTGGNHGDEYEGPIALFDLARSLELELLAEGVETEDQREMLQALGCRFGQGYLFGRARPL